MHRNKHGRGLTVARYRYGFTLSNAIKQLTEMGLRVQYADLFHNTSLDLYDHCRVNTIPALRPDILIA